MVVGFRGSRKGEILSEQLAHSVSSTWTTRSGSGLFSGQLTIEVRRAALEAGLVPPQVDPFLVIESVDETPAIGPEGRGRRVRLKAIDETGEQDIGTLFVPIDPRERP